MMSENGALNSTESKKALSLVIALRPQTPKPIRGGWSQYTVTSEPVDGNGAQNMVNVQSVFRPRDLSITGPTRLPPALTGEKERVRKELDVGHNSGSKEAVAVGKQFKQRLCIPVTNFCMCYYDSLSTCDRENALHDLSLYLQS
jgi:hypothetical protein